MAVYHIFSFDSLIDIELNVCRANGVHALIHCGCVEFKANAEWEKSSPFKRVPLTVPLRAIRIAANLSILCLAFHILCSVDANE